MVDWKSKFYCASSDFVESFFISKKILLCTLQGNILLFSVIVIEIGDPQIGMEPSKSAISFFCLLVIFFLKIFM